MCRRATRDEQVRQGGRHVLMPELPRHDERQTFPAGFVDDREDAELAAVMRTPLDEVVGSHMPRILRPQADA
jgi:hypothetical protein